MSVVAVCEQCRLSRSIVPGCRACAAMNETSVAADARPLRAVPPVSVLRGMDRDGVLHPTIGRHPESIEREPTPADIEHVLAMKGARRREEVLARARGMFEHAAARSLTITTLTDDVEAGDIGTQWWGRVAREAERAAEAWRKLEDGDCDRAHEAEQLARFVLRQLVASGLSTSAETFREHLEYYITVPASVVGRGSS